LIAAQLGTTSEAFVAPQWRRLGRQTTVVFVILTVALVGWGLFWFLD